jgi:hypothetical protein
MAADAEVVALIRADGTQILATCKSVTDAMRGLQNAGGKSLESISNTADAASKKIQNSLGNIDFRGQLDELGALSRGFLEFGKGIVDATMRFDQFRATFKQLTGSPGAAGKELQILQEEAKKSSFSVEEIIEAGARLRQSGLGIDRVVKDLQQARDVAAATGQPLAEISGFLARGRRGDQDALTVLQERGIVSKEQLRKLGANFDQGTNAIKGQLSEDRTKLTAAMDKGISRFSGTDAALVDTLKGQISNLGDEVTRAADSIGKVMSPTLKELAVSVRLSVEAFQRFSPETQSLIATTILVGGAVAATTLAFAALAGPIGTVLAVGSSLAAAAFVPATVALLPLGLAIQKVGLAVVSVTFGLTAMKAALIATQATVLAFGVAVAYMSVEMIKTNKVLKDFDRDFGSRDKGMKKFQNAIGGFQNISKVTAADLKRLGLTAKDVTDAMAGLQDIDEQGMDSEKQKELAFRIKKTRELAISLGELERAEKKANSVQEINKLADPAVVNQRDRQDAEKKLKTLDAENAGTEKRLEVLNQILKTNGLVKRDDMFRLEIQGKINDLLKKQNDDKVAASKKAVQTDVKRATDAGNKFDAQAQNVSAQAAALGPKDAAERTRLEQSAFNFEQSANKARIAALQTVITKHKLAGDERKAVEAKIFALESKNNNARIKQIDDVKKAQDAADKAKEDARKKEEEDLATAAERRIQLEQETVDRQIALAKQAVEEGTGGQGAVDDLLRQRQGLAEQLINIALEAQNAEQKSDAVRIANEQNAAIEIANSRADTEIAIKSYDETLRESAETTKETAQESVQAVQQQVVATKAALQSLDDVLAGQSANFGIDAVRARTDEIRAGREQKAGQAKANAQKANPELFKANAEVDRARGEALKASQRAQVEADKLKRRQQAEAVVAAQLKKQPTTPTSPTSSQFSSLMPNARTMAPEIAKRVNAETQRSARTDVNVRVEVTVKDSKGNAMAQDGPAKVTIGGRGSDIKTASVGMPLSSGGGLSSGVGMG